MKQVRIYLGILAAVFFAVSCNDDTTDMPPVDAMLPISEVISTSTLTLNPSGYAPLSALLEMSLFENVHIKNVHISNVHTYS